MGILTFILVAGRHFRPQRGLFFLSDAPDVYVVARLGATSVRTATAPNTCTPDWHHTATALVHHREQELGLAVWEDDVLADDALGGATVSVATLAAAGEGGLWLPVEPAAPTGPPAEARARKAAAAAKAAAKADGAAAPTDDPPAVHAVGTMARLVAAGGGVSVIAPRGPPTTSADEPALEGSSSGGDGAPADDEGDAARSDPPPRPPPTAACLAVLIDSAPAGVAPAGATVACRCRVSVPAPAPSVGNDGDGDDDAVAGDPVVLHEWTTHVVTVVPAEGGGGAVGWLRSWELPLTAADVAAATLTVGLVIDGEQPAGRGGGSGGVRLDALAAAAGGSVRGRGGGGVRWQAHLLAVEDRGRDGAAGDAPPRTTPRPDA